ncbi:hypothetical protein D3C87_351720 [compost metagenome]
MNKTKFFGGVTLLLIGSTGTAFAAGACDTDHTRQIKRKMEQQAIIECNSPAVDTNNTLTMPDGSTNPYVYQNPDAGCDLGFRLPGLSGGGSGLSGDSCGILKSVTGDMVNKANQEAQQKVNDILDNIPGGGATIDGIMDGKVDIDDIKDLGESTIEDAAGTGDMNDIILDQIGK